MASCRQCGKELPKVWDTDICLDCSRMNVQKIFRKDTQLKEAFKETIDEMRQPENVQKMANDIYEFMSAVQGIRGK